MDNTEAENLANIQGEKMISISKASEALGVSLDTMRVWDKKGVLKPDFKADRGDRYYKVQTLIDFNPLKKEGLSKYLQQPGE